MNDTLVNTADGAKTVPDRTLHTAPFGLCFWDAVGECPVADGLSVSAYPGGNPLLRTKGVPNPSRIFSFHGLAGLRDFELGGGAKEWEDLDPWASPVTPRHFCIETTDNDRRFLPFLLHAEVPNKGIWVWKEGASSPPDAGNPSVPLFSAPFRPVPPGMAAIRAALWDPNERRAAAWAFVEASFQGQLLTRGIADQKGRVVLIFPYPEPARPQFGSPAVSPPAAGSIVPLSKQEWLIDLQILYKPNPAPPEIPDLREVIFNQPHATLWQEETLENPLLQTSLKFGTETVLRTKKTGSGMLPELYITSTGSPP